METDAKEFTKGSDPDGFIEGSVQCTESGCQFVEQHGLDLLAFTAARVNEQILIRFHKDLQLALDPDQEESGLKSIRDHPQLQMNRIAGDKVEGELILVRYVDSYLTYLSELLREIFIARPEVLKSGEQVSIKDILQFPNIPDLVNFIADRKITQLSYSGLGDISKFFQEKLGLELIDDDGLSARMQEWVALRNLYTHRRGVVDKRALDAGLEGKYKVGERARFLRRDGVEAMKGIFSAMRSIDQRAATKYRLATRSAAALSAHRSSPEVASSSTTPELETTTN